MNRLTNTSPVELEVLWETYGNGKKLTVREQLVILSAFEIARVGTLEFNAKNPCAAIDANSSIVNYYFGGREGLMAEAAVFVHDQWILAIQRSLSSKPSDPEKQMHKLIQADIAFVQEWGAMASFAAYPNSSPVLRSLFVERFESRAQDAVEYYLAVLTQLIFDARAGNKSLIDFDIGTLPKYKLATHASALLAATSLTWSFHGLTTWVAGQHAPSQHIEDPTTTPLTTKVAMKHHIKHCISSAIRG